MEGGSHQNQRRTNTLSGTTQTLLSQGESELADFKRTPDGINVDDLVAFANTDSGGTILVGIDEQTNTNGAQVVVREELPRGLI
jgi:predicted HTH transcriptional regulator